MFYRPSGRKFDVLLYFLFIVELRRCVGGRVSTVNRRTEATPEHATADPAKTTRNGPTNERDQNKHWREQLKNR
jgi:hypothetical protein